MGDACDCWSLHNLVEEKQQQQNKKERNHALCICADVNQHQMHKRNVETPQLNQFISNSGTREIIAYTEQFDLLYTLWTW